DGASDNDYADASDVSDDNVFEQVEYEYDDSGNVLSTTTRQRFHDETDPGSLGDSDTGPYARVSYMGYYYDLADRLVATLDVGTYEGDPWSRPGIAPSSSATELVTGYEYDEAGRLKDVTDPAGRIHRTEYDALGRTTKTIENYVNGVVSDSDDKTTVY